MKFGFMFDSPAYEPKIFEADSIVAAIQLLQSRVPEREYARAGINGPINPDFHVELWLDKGSARKDMSFEDLKSVYKLYPAKTGHLVSNELTESLWKDLQNQSTTRNQKGETILANHDWMGGFFAGCPKEDIEDWLGHHHSRGIDYLRYGSLGENLGAQRLAEIGRQFLERAEDIAEYSGVTLDHLYNHVGVTHQDYKAAMPGVSNEPFYTVETDIAPHDWFFSIDAALETVKQKKDYVDMDIRMNGDMPIGHVIGGKLVSPDLHEFSGKQFEQAQDALSAFQAMMMRMQELSAPYYDRLFFAVGEGQTPPTNIFFEFKEEAKDRGIYDMVSALSAFSEVPDAKGKTLYAAYGRDIGGQCNLQFVPLMMDYKGNLYFYNAEDWSSESCSIMRPIVKECLNAVFPFNEMRTGKWGVKIVAPGERYGLGNSVLNDSGKPLVEFYDHSQDPAKFPKGQFVTRYYMDQLLGRGEWGIKDAANGLSLDSAIPDWTVSSANMQTILTWLRIKDKSMKKERKPSLESQMKSAQRRQTDDHTQTPPHRKEQEL